jgi:hypothetical protein
VSQARDIIGAFSHAPAPTFPSRLAANPPGCENHDLLPLYPFGRWRKPPDVTTSRRPSTSFPRCL